MNQWRLFDVYSFMYFPSNQLFLLLTIHWTISFCMLIDYVTVCFVWRMCIALNITQSYSPSQTNMIY